MLRAKWLEVQFMQDPTVAAPEYLESTGPSGDTSLRNTSSSAAATFSGPVEVGGLPDMIKSATLPVDVGFIIIVYMLDRTSRYSAARPCIPRVPPSVFSS